jgi:hypothetical protein
MSLRDADITPVADTLVKPMSSVDSTRTRIQISDPISISLEEHEPTNHKKQVQWGENTEHVFDKTQSIYESALIKKVQALDDKIDSLTHTVESLTHNMELMIQKFDAMINPPITKSIDE